MENKNMKKCKDCGNYISKKAKVCPHCGRDDRQNPALIVIGIILMLYGLFGYFSTMFKILGK